MSLLSPNTMFVIAFRAVNIDWQTLQHCFHSWLDKIEVREAKLRPHRSLFYSLKPNVCFSPLKLRSSCFTINLKRNKAISMMRGKSQRSDDKMSKNSITWQPSWIFGVHFSIHFDQIWYTHIKFTSE